MTVQPAVPSGPTQAPNETIYVKNLEESIKIDKLVAALTEVFEDSGTIVEIVAKASVKRKGQAFIVFDDVESATAAITENQGFELFGKPMILDYAKTKSDATVRENGNEEEFENHKRKRLAEKERKQAAEEAEAAKRLKQEGPVGADLASRPLKTGRGAGLKPTGAAAGAVVPEEYLPPNNILFVQNLPDDYGVDALTAIFGRFEGFREVRTVPGRAGIAFVEYEAEQGAIAAKERTSGMTLGDESKPMKVVYQRK